MAVAENILTAQPDLAGLFASSEASSIGSIRAIRSRQMSGKVRLVTFDVSDTHVEALRDGTAFFYLRNVNSGHPGSITTVHADSARLAFEQLTLLVKESAEGRDLHRDDIRSLLLLLVDVVIQMQKRDGRYRISEIYYDPVRKRDHIS